jgi:uncharacterized repeat protein (TIGR03806 family)
MRRSFLLASGLAFSVLAAIATACGDDAASTPDGSDGGPEAGTTPEGGSVPDSTAPPSASPFGLESRPSNTTCLAPARPASDAPVTFERVFANVTLSTPMMLRQPPGDPSRWFVAQRDGVITTFPTVNPPAGATTRVFVTPIQANAAGEGGLLGFVFHPKFAQNGRLFFSWTPLDATVPTSQMRSVIARVETTDGGKTFGNYTEIVSFPQTTATNHKGGSIEFGPDGYLYFGFGDGGGGGDTYIHGQSKDSYFAKIHRIDVDTPPPAGATYVVPDGNPFKAGSGQPSTYVYGLRNPFRFSFDRVSGDMWIGDVGQGVWEEIDRVLAPGANLGWPCREGAHDYAAITDALRCPNPKAGFLEPVFDYDHGGGVPKAVTGGVVYRGKAIPQLVGTYLFGDSSTAELWSLRYDPVTGKPSSVRLNPAGPNGSWLHFAEDSDGEVYVVDIGGKVYKIVPAAPAADAGTPAAFPEKLSATGCVDPKDPRIPAAGLVPYGVNSPLWSDGAQKDRWLAIPDGKTIAVDAAGHLDLPIGSVLMKTFSLGGKRIETRLFVHHADGDWAGYTYEWNDAETEATLLPSSKSKTVGAQTWSYPSRSDCFSCHSGAAKRTLGMELGQLNRDYVYPSTNRISNQLATLDHVGMFSAPLGAAPGSLVAYPAPTGTSSTLEARARAYLHANCAMCHQPNSNGGGAMDMRFATAFADTRMCNVGPDDGTLGVTGAKIVLPGAPSKSILSLRPHALDATRMPPLASHLVDTAGVAVIDAWITSLTSCPPAGGPTDAGGD